MRKLWLGPLALAIATAASPSRAAEAPVVQVSQGDVAGSMIDGYAVFRGIPYAAPPVGPLRWRAPQPVAAWEGVRPATGFGPMCAQPDPKNGTLKGQEDCLTVNVWTPDTKPAAKRPVMVWIHGGAFFVGNGAQWLDQGISALSKEGVVLVSFNYRLGRFGFFAHPALTKEHPEEGTGNFWLMDQIAALKWVRENIGAFGGDPNNVTIFGVSAGGTSVNALVASPEARGLFEKAIAMSGGSLFNATKSLADAEQVGEQVAERAGATGPDAIGKLRSMSAAQIIANEKGPPAYGAIIDGMVLTDALPASFSKGNIADVAYMAGSTSNEFVIFGMMGFTGKTLEDRFGVDMAAARKVYEADGALDEDALVSQVGTDFIFTAGAQGLAAMAARNGHDAYTYELSYVASPWRGKIAGVPHGGDQMYLFGLDYRPEGDRMAGTYDPAPSEKDRQVAAAMRGYWVNFARTGDPNGPGLPAWGKHAPPAPETLVIGDDIRSVPDFRKDRLQLWFDKWQAETGLTVE
ncbi:MAG: carboxylesterase family protein [Alphaproteobacteria bacterium]|nr:carboxylesterase family protein [Alphaproteobacteria bacterium]